MKTKTIISTLLIITVLISCSSDNNTNQSKIDLLIGKWAWGTLGGKCTSYREFKTNHILTYVQYFDNCNNQTIDNLAYKVVENEIIYDDTSDNEKIIEITNSIMVTTFQDPYLGIQTRSYTRIP
jgi:hypothetical protein